MTHKALTLLLGTAIIQSCTVSSEILLCSDRTSISINNKLSHFTISSKNDSEKLSSDVKNCKFREYMCIIEPFPFIDPKAFEENSIKAIYTGDLVFELVSKDIEKYVILSYFRNTPANKTIITYSSFTGIEMVNFESAGHSESLTPCGNLFKI